MAINSQLSGVGRMPQAHPATPSCMALLPQRGPNAQCIACHAMSTVPCDSVTFPICSVKEPQHTILALWAGSILHESTYRYPGVALGSLVCHFYWFQRA